MQATVKQYDADDKAAGYAGTKGHNSWVQVALPTLRAAIGDIAAVRAAIDVGCGDGAAARVCASLGARKVVGVDVSADMIKLAQANEEAAPLGMKFRVADATNLAEVADELGPFDFAVSSFVLQHANSVADLYSLIAGVARVLSKPGGRFAGVYSVVTAARSATVFSPSARTPMPLASSLTPRWESQVCELRLDASCLSIAPAVTLRCCRRTWSLMANADSRLI